MKSTRGSFVKGGDGLGDPGVEVAPEQSVLPMLPPQFLNCQVARP